MELKSWCVPTFFIYNSHTTRIILFYKGYPHYICVYTVSFYSVATVDKSLITEVMQKMCIQIYKVVGSYMTITSKIWLSVPIDSSLGINTNLHFKQWDTLYTQISHYQLFSSIKFHMHIQDIQRDEHFYIKMTMK